MRAIWAKQFQALRDGDRFFFGNDQGLSFIKNTYGIDFRHTLAQIIQMNTGITAADQNPTGNLFFKQDADLPATTCSIDYTIVNIDGSPFKGVLAIKNTSNQFVAGWTLKWELAQGQQLVSDSGIQITQSGPNGMNWKGTDIGFNAVIAPGDTIFVSFFSSFDDVARVNQKPGNFSLNGKRCAVT
jgi:peroxidase